MSNIAYYYPGTYKCNHLLSPSSSTEILKFEDSLNIFRRS